MSKSRSTHIGASSTLQLPIFRTLLQSVRSNHWPECTQHNSAWAKVRFQYPGCICRLRHDGQETGVFEYIARIGGGCSPGLGSRGICPPNGQECVPGNLASAGKATGVVVNPGSQPHSLRTPRSQIQIRIQACCLRRRVGQAAAMDRSSSNDGHVESSAIQSRPAPCRGDGVRSGFELRAHVQPSWRVRRMGFQVAQITSGGHEPPDSTRISSVVSWYFVATHVMK
jgi:hypothetical protein